LDTQTSQTLLGFIGGLALGPYVHEIGHVLGAKLVSIKVERCVIGVGPILVRWRLGGVSFEIRAVPLSGATYPQPMLRLRKYAQIMFLLGGVAGNLIAALVVIGVSSVLQLRGIAGACIVLTQIFFTIGNLWPRVYRNRGGIASDGLQIWQTIKCRNATPTPAGQIYLSLIRRYDANRDETAIDHPDAASILYFLARPDNSTGEPIRQNLLLLLRSASVSSDHANAEPLLLLEALNLRGLLDHPQAEIEQLLAWSDRANAIASNSAATQEIRAFVLLEAGRREEGRALLDQLEPAQTPAGAMVRQFFLARSEYRTGSHTAARALLAAARPLIDNPKVLLALRDCLRRSIAEIGLPMPDMAPEGVLIQRFRQFVRRSLPWLRQRGPGPA
jgi:Peptidase family M50